MIEANVFWAKVQAAFLKHYNSQFYANIDQSENISDFLSTMDVLADEWYNKDNKKSKQ